MPAGIYSGSKKAKYLNRKYKDRVKMLTGGQAKIAAKAPPPNKIDEKDFAVLRAEKAKGRGMGLQDEKVKPGKVVKADMGKFLGKLTKPLGRLFGRRKKTVMSGNNQTAGSLKGMGKMLPDLLQKAIDDGTIKTAKQGKMMKYKKGSGLDLPVISSVKPTVNKTKRAQNLARMREEFNKQKSRMGKNPNKTLDSPKAGDKFLKRRKALNTAGKVISATKVGKIVLPIVGAGVAAQQYLKSKMKKDKKMGGGMMQRPMGYKGGGMDTGKVGEMKSRVTLAVDRLKKAKKFMGRGTGRLTDSDKEKIKSLVGKGQAIRPIKKMGGGMMNKPMSYNTGGPSAGFKSKQDRKKAEKNIKQARSKEGLRSFLSSGNKINQPMRKERYMEGRKARHTEFKKKIGRTALGIASSLNPVTSIAKGIGKVMGKGSKKRDFQKGDYGDISVKKNMGGMMMQRPMGYKYGTSVTAKCKLGRNKPTKIT